MWISTRGLASQACDWMLGMQISAKAALSILKLKKKMLQLLAI